MHIRTDPTGGVTTWTRDIEGRVTQRQEPNGGITTFAYDVANRKTSWTDPLGQIVSYLANECAFNLRFPRQYKMARVLFSALFVMFLALFVWEGLSTARMIYGNAYANALQGNFLFWVIIGLLAAGCSGALTWYTMYKEQRKGKNGS